MKGWSLPRRAQAGGVFRPASEFVDDAPRLTATGEREVIGIHGLLPIAPASSGQAGIVGTKR